MNKVDATPNHSSSLPKKVVPQPIFATTHWSIVQNAGCSDEPAAKAALEVLCQTYWRPLYVFALRRGITPADAEDLTQSFFAWVLQRDWLSRADRQRGRFRSFLLTSFTRFLTNEWDKTQAQKRGGGLIVSMRGEMENGGEPEPADHLTPEQSFEWRWALSLLELVMQKLASEYVDQGKAELFAELKPCLLGESTAQPYAALSVKLGMSEGAIKVAVHRLRQRYRQILREEIANTVESPEEIEDEMRYLFAVIAR